MEEEILKFWEKEKIFEKSLELRRDAELYSFYDGPPFATGTPHYGHIVASTMKDVVPRYWTMRGFNVPRVWGWDCHGLPIENIAEKELGITRKKEILEKYGVAKFNEICRSKVLEYVEEWKKVIKRLGRWADMENAYKTMDLEFMESVWWVFKQLWDKGLIYEGHRSMHICPRCETTLSQSEVAEGYKMVKDLSVTAKFELVDEPGTYLLAWTTTPWTLIGNVALAVNEKLRYVKIKFSEIRENNSKLDIKEGETYIIEENRIKSTFGFEIFDEEKEPKLHATYKTSIYQLGGIMGNEPLRLDVDIEYELIPSGDLIEKKYKSLFDYYSSDENLKNRENGWKIYPADFVTTEEGTGIVHIASAFGEDDMNLGKKFELPFISHVDMDGTIRPEAKDFAGLDVKPIEDSKKTDVEIIKYLAKKNLLFSKQQYEHSYPHCWRCDTPLLNYATSSWFVSIEKIKAKMLELAKDISWSPSHIKVGRFGNWLEGARDWSISRQRFWASVIPIWRCGKCNETKVVGSVDEIRGQFGNPNKLFLIRHGEAENNVKNILSSYPEKGTNSLTADGKNEVKKTLETLKDKKIDIIFSSPLQRAKETAEIISESLGKEVIVDKKLRETDMGKLNGGGATRYKSIFDGTVDLEKNQIEKSEELKKRATMFVDELNQNYQGKNILIVSHGDPIRFIKGACAGSSLEEILTMDYPYYGGYEIVYSKPVDLHKHAVDKITFPCEKCQGEMKRVPDVLDTWFDSGSMPYAQTHYPFENKENFEKSFPADFIAEGVDQTRAWFYYLHAIATAIKDSKAYKNVIVNGIVLAEDGKKMSKRLQNYPDPTEVMEKYGADALRYYLMGSPVVAADNLNFSEKDLAENVRGMFRMLWNTYSFFVLYANIDKFEPKLGSKAFSRLSLENLLDKWIVSELHQLIKNANQHMESYELNKAARLFPAFIDNLSNWYVRRSRKRFWKSENDSDKKQAYVALHYVLTQLAKLMAPFTPFVAEEIYKNLMEGGRLRQGSGEPLSVHLADFPQADEKLIDAELNKQMQLVRRFVKLGLAARAKAGIKVRQPLAEMHINEVIPDELAELVKDEVNVKKIQFVGSVEQMPGIYTEQEGNSMIGLNIVLTGDLRLEGEARELIRRIQELRKKAGYDVDNCVTLYYFGGTKIFQKFGDLIAKEVLSAGAIEGENPEHDISEVIDLETAAVRIWLKRVE